MGAGASVEGYDALPEEKKAELKTQYDALIAEGKSEDEAVEACKTAAAAAAAAAAPAAEGEAAAAPAAEGEAPPAFVAGFFDGGVLDDAKIQLIKDHFADDSAVEFAGEFAPKGADGNAITMPRDALVAVLGHLKTGFSDFKVRIKCNPSPPTDPHITISYFSLFPF